MSAVPPDLLPRPRVKDFKDEGSKLDAILQRVAMMLNGYLRATLARKQSDMS
jgi:hypothetical protein